MLVALALAKRDNQSVDHEVELGGQPQLSLGPELLLSASRTRRYRRACIVTSTTEIQQVQDCVTVMGLVYLEPAVLAVRGDRGAPQSVVANLSMNRRCK